MISKSQIGRRHTGHIKFVGVEERRVGDGITRWSSLVRRVCHGTQNLVVPTYNEWTLIQPTDEQGRIKHPSRVQVMTWTVDTWTQVTPRIIDRSVVLTGGSRMCNTPLGFDDYTRM